MDDNKQLLSQIIMGNAVATFVINKQHVITHWNTSCENLSGLSVEEMIGTSTQWKAFYDHERPVLADLVLQDNTEELVKKRYPLKAKHSKTIKDAYEAVDFFPHLGKEGRWLFFTAAPLVDEDGKLIGAIETLQDITKQKVASKELKKSEERQEQIIKCSAVPTFVINNDHIVTHWNHSCANLTGIQACDMIGTQNHWKAFYENKRPTLADLILDKASEEKFYEFYGDRAIPSSIIRDAYEAELFFPNIGDSGRWVFATAALLKDKGGFPIGAIETHQDITHKKRTENALRISQANYKSAFQRSNLYKDLFAHDINNILQNLQSIINLLPFYLEKTEEAKELYEIIGIAQDQVYRGAKLVSNVHTLSEIEEKEWKLEGINLTKVLESSLSYIKKIYKQRDYTLHIGKNLEGGNIFIRGNEILIDVFENILANAFRHNDNELVKIEIDAQEVKQDGMHYIQLIFMDNGIGVPDQLKRSIFTREPLTKDHSGGLGLGLALVKKIILMHGGKIWVENRIPHDYSQGSAFHLLLPQA